MGTDSETPAYPVLQVDGVIDGFIYLWLKYVRGFNPNQCCAKSLVGPFCHKIVKGMGPISIVLDEEEPGSYDYVYLCGVSDGFRMENNLHLAAKPVEQKPRDDVPCAEAVTYKGVHVAILGAEKIDILPLTDPDDAPTERQAACRNYQFAHQQYGESTL